MRILAVETIGMTGTVAVLDGATVLAERDLSGTQRSAQSLAPGISALLEQVGWQPTDLQLISAATGPGSFTGLRIGVTTAKTLAYAIGCPVVGVNSLAAIAQRVPSEHARFSVVLDAQRGELFVADFLRAADGTLSGSKTTRVEVASSWLAGLPAGTLVTGPGLSAVRKKLPAGLTLVDESLWAPRAADVGRLGWGAFQAVGAMNAFDLVPHYFRRTAAEEQWERRAAN